MVPTAEVTIPARADIPKIFKMGPIKFFVYLTFLRFSTFVELQPKKISSTGIPVSTEMVLICLTVAL